MLLAELLADPYWAGSSKDKVPLYLGDYLKSGGPLYPVSKQEFSKLNTANEIKQNETLKDALLCYRMHAKDNYVIVFDVESSFTDPPKTAKKYSRWFYEQKAHYKEWSQHLGLHLFYKIKFDRLSDNAKKILLTRTEIKVTHDDLDYEIIMNNHFITFTFNKIDEMPLDEDAPDWVYAALEDGAKDIKGIMPSQVTTPTEVADRLYSLYLQEDTEYLAKLRTLTISDMHSKDESKSGYEYGIAIRLASYLNRKLSAAEGIERVVLGQNPKDVTLSDKAWAVSRKLSEIAEKRPKWDEQRDGLPWTTYVAKSALEYLQSH